MTEDTDSTVIHIPLREAHVVRVFDVAEDDSSPLPERAVLAALGADGDLRTEDIELFDIEELGDMTLSAYLADGHGIGAAELEGMRGQLDTLSRRVLIVPSRAFQGSAMTLRLRGTLRLVGRFEEEGAPVRFDTLPSGGTQARPGAAAPPGPGMRYATLALLVLLIGVAALVVALLVAS